MVSTGTLQVGNGGSAGSTALGTGSVTDNATLAFNFGGATTIANTLNGAGTFANPGTGAVTLSNNAFSNGATINGGTAGIVCGTSLPNTAGVSLLGVVTINGNCPNETVSSGGPGTTINVTTGLSTWWTGTTTQANVPNYNISTGATVSDNSGQGAGTMYFNNLSGGGNLTYYSSGPAYILGTTSLTGTITGGNQALYFGTGGAGGAFSGGGPASIVDTAGVTFNSTTSTTFAGAISGGGSVTKSGTNALALTGQNTYTGNTNVSGGTLDLSGAGGIYTNATKAATDSLVISGGGVLLTRAWGRGAPPGHWAS